MTKTTLKTALLVLIISLTMNLATLSFYHRFIHQEIRMASIDFERLIKTQRDWLLDSDLENIEQLTIATYLNQRLSRLLEINSAQTIFINGAVIVSGVSDRTDHVLNIQQQQFEQALFALNEVNNETLVV